MSTKSIHDVLHEIQTELKAPKNQYNSFGGYSYRSTEDILEGLKPLLHKHKAVVLLNDTIKEVGGRVYVEATAVLQTADGHITTTAFAREAVQKKGMDESQITGSTSSYARKYALNGLFAIDDTKDADSTNNHGKGKTTQPQKAKTAPVSNDTHDVCSVCQEEITPRVKQYSEEKFQQALCFNCQKKKENK